MINEFTIQNVFFNWCQKQDFIKTHWSVPNGFKSNSKQAHFMKITGMRAGVWDYWLILQNGTLAVIEFKTEKGNLSKEQIIFEEALSLANIPHKVCYSTFEATSFIKSLV